MAVWVRVVMLVLCVVVGVPAALFWVVRRVRGLIGGLVLWWVFGLLGWVEVWAGPLGLPWVLVWPLTVVLGVWWVYAWVRLTRTAWRKAVKVAAGR